MDAWIDCITSLDVATDGMTSVSVNTGGLLIMEINDVCEFEKRCPEQYRALIECTAFVNFRRIEAGDSPVLGLLLIGNK